MSDTVHEGGCTCGALRYSIQGAPIFVNNCYCTLCQRQTGSTSVVNAFYETERFTLLSGALSMNSVPAGSGKPHEIHRCSACGTAIFSHYPRLGGLGLGLRVGTLDDSSTFKPDAAIFTASKMPWVALPDGVPAYEAAYNAKELLPEDRLARLMALVEKRAAQQA